MVIDFHIEGDEEVGDRLTPPVRPPGEERLYFRGIQHSGPVDYTPLPIHQGRFSPSRMRYDRSGSIYCGNLSTVDQVTYIAGGNENSRIISGFTPDFALHVTDTGDFVLADGNFVKIGSPHDGSITILDERLYNYQVLGQKGLKHPVVDAPSHVYAIRRPDDNSFGIVLVTPKKAGGNNVVLVRAPYKNRSGFPRYGGNEGIDLELEKSISFDDGVVDVAVSKKVAIGVATGEGVVILSSKGVERDSFSFSEPDHPVQIIAGEAGIFYTLTDNGLILSHKLERRPSRDRDKKSGYHQSTVWAPFDHLKGIGFDVRDVRYIAMGPAGTIYAITSHGGAILIDPTKPEHQRVIAEQQLLNLSSDADEEAIEIHSRVGRSREFAVVTRSGQAPNTSYELHWGSLGAS